MLDLGVNEFNETMKNAASYGQIDIIKMMLDLGATNFNITMLNIINYINTHYKILMSSGCRRAHPRFYAKDNIIVIKQLLDLGANNYEECNKINKDTRIKKLLRQYM